MIQHPTNQEKARSVRYPSVDETYSAAGLGVVTPTFRNLGAVNLKIAKTCFGDRKHQPGSKCSPRNNTSGQAAPSNSTQQ